MKVFKIAFAAAFILAALGACASSNKQVPNSIIYEASSDNALQNVLALAQKHNDTMIFVPPAPFKLYDPGTDKWVDYEKYGEFQNEGTANYKYVVKDSDRLKAASGEGIYPNSQSIFNNPEFQKARNAKKLEGSHWDFINTDDFQLNFFKWAATNEDPGVKLYFTALALDRAGNYAQAVKAYYAVLVFFPKSVGWTQWKTPWYIGPVCISRIRFLTARYPKEVGVRLTGAKIFIENGFDNDIKNDVFTISPGRLVPATAKDFEQKTIDLSKIGVKKTIGSGKVKIVQYKNNHYQLLVNGKPFVVKGMTYAPNKIGLSPVDGTLNNTRDWSWDDFNKNGRIDGPFDSWVDANRNEKQDSNEPVAGDYALLQAMGVNTIRIFHHGGLNHDVLKEGYEKYGFMYMMTDFLGMYAVGSGASWEEGTDYTNPVHLKNMLESVRQMVEEYKNEPYILMWVLGNENNFGGAANADKHPKAFYKFVNDAAKLIKQLDPQKRPVAISNGDTVFLDICAKYAPDIDIFGFNSYRGEQGFGNVWQDISIVYGKPALLTEYGCPAYAAGWTTARIEQANASYHKGNWTDIANNLGGVEVEEGGWGNSLGGAIFEWIDEWWKAEDADPYEHDTHPQMQGAYLDGGGYEEWYGITSQGDGKDSPFKRQLRKAYFMYKEIWNK
ncbi:MAG: hypothetical protein FWG57_03910 [Endomicrobia bacterium]|nr:hypothetical protein [Endomicrobiia bacterium]